MRVPTRRPAVLVAVPRPVPRPAFDPLDHLKWARVVARTVRASFGFRRGSQEEYDLESVAYLELVRLCQPGRFDWSWVPAGGDPAGAFRGWAFSAIRGECRREARRLLNAGTYWTRRETDHEPVEATQLSHCKNDDGTPREPPDPASLTDPDLDD